MRLTARAGGSLEEHIGQSRIPGRVNCYDNGQMKSFWARMQVELLNRKRWNTRLELANAILEHLEIFHDRQRRHSSLGMLSPIEYETRHAEAAARDQAS